MGDGTGEGEGDGDGEARGTVGAIGGGAGGPAGPFPLGLAGALGSGSWGGPLGVLSLDPCDVASIASFTAFCIRYSTSFLEYVFGVFIRSTWRASCTRWWMMWGSLSFTNASTMLLVSVRCPANSCPWVSLEVLSSCRASAICRSLSSCWFLMCCRNPCSFSQYCSAVSSAMDPIAWYSLLRFSNAW